MGRSRYFYDINTEDADGERLVPGGIYYAARFDEYRLCIDAGQQSVAFMNLETNHLLSGCMIEDYRLVGTIEGWRKRVKK